jgi:hypothetical protein
MHSWKRHSRPSKASAIWARGHGQILRHSGYLATPDADPVYLYCDVLIGIFPERGLNNGLPSYHAPLLASAAIRAGEHVSEPASVTTVRFWRVSSAAPAG